MPATLSDFDIFLLITAILSALLLIVWLDRYLTRRRSAALNARHLGRILANANVVIPPVANVLAFRRQRELRDDNGQVVAVQIEEIRAGEFEHSDIFVPRRRTLLLPAAA